MGKGSRNREIRISQNDAAENSGVKLSKKQLIKQQEKKEKIKKYTTMGASLAIIAALVIGIVACTLGKRVVLEPTVSATSEKYEINNAMMAYMMYSQYNQYVSENSAYLTYLGLDTTKSLKSQTAYENTTWFDYFMVLAKSSVSELVALASEAQDKGYALDDEEKQYISDVIAEIKAAAKNNGYGKVNSFLSDFYTPGVTISAVEDCLELQSLASKYYSDLVESYEFDESQISEYVEKNPESFYKFDYLTYSFDCEKLKEDATEEEKNQVVADAKAEAESFLNDSVDEESFKANIIALEKEKETSNSKTEASTTDKKEKTDADYLSDFEQKGAAYIKDDDFSAWAFKSERKSGDTTIIEEKDSDGNITGYSVYWLQKTAYKNETLTRDVRHILIEGTGDDSKAKAEEILAEYKAGEQTAEAFGKLAEKYSDDPGSGKNGGLYEEVFEGEMVTTFNDWLFAEKRVVGETGIISSDYGYHVMYYVGINRETWKINSENSLSSEKYQDDLKELKEKHTLTFDDTKLNDIQ